MHIVRIAFTVRDSGLVRFPHGKSSPQIHKVIHRLSQP